MNINFHIYHHLGADELSFLLHSNKQISEIKSKLKTLKEILVTMAKNQDELGKTLAEIQAEQQASAARWEVRNTAQQQTITDLKKLVDDLTAKNENSDAELSDELALAQQILRTEQQTFADAQTPVETSTEETSTDETGEPKTEESEQTKSEESGQVESAEASA